MPDAILSIFESPNLFIYKQEHEKVSQMQVWAEVLNILVILKYIIKAINFHSQYVCSKINLRTTALLQELTLTYLLTSLTLMLVLMLVL